MNDSYSTGYFAAPGKRPSNVHGLKNGKPICGYKPAPGMEFQWCAGGLSYDYIKCKRCRERATKLMIKHIHIVLVTVQQGVK